ADSLSYIMVVRKCFSWVSSRSWQSDNNAGPEMPLRSESASFSRDSSSKRAAEESLSEYFSQSLRGT
ncbi:MAG TPA: hypothetical protein VLE19_18100, partial [Pyrinomonadaceae bacterium]|nr:hypothetical protein [Pyrinomonadaceae bacterium]